MAIQEEAQTRGLLDRAVPIAPIRTEDYPTPARRPAYSVLDCAALTALRGRPLKPWRAALADFLAHENLLVTR